MELNEAITTVIAGLIVAFRKDVTDWWQKRKRKILLTTLSDTGMIYAKVFNYILDDSDLGIERFILFEANYTGKLTASSDVFVTAIMEDYRPPFKSSLDDIQNWRADSQYIQMLIDIKFNNSCTFYVDQMPESKLKKLYESANVNCAKAIFIDEATGRIIYCSLASSKRINYSDSKVATKVDTATNRLKDIILKYL